LVSALAYADPEATIYAVPPFAPELDATISSCRDEIWSAWRDGKQPALDETVNAVIYYTQRDAYEPVD